jgi:hypothetical protein
MGVGLLAVWATGRHIERLEHNDRRIGPINDLLARAKANTPEVFVAAATRPQGNPCTVHTPRILETTWQIFRAETVARFRGPGIWLFGGIGALFTWTAAAALRGFLQTTELATTGRVALTSFRTLTTFLCLLVLFYTVEGFVREEKHKLDTIFQASPISTAAILAGKILANASTVSFVLGGSVAAIALKLAVQPSFGGSHIPLEGSVLLLFFGGLLQPTLIAWGAFVCFVYSVLRHRVAVYAITLAALAAPRWAAENESDLLTWASDWALVSMVERKIPWSELDRFGFMKTAMLTNRALALSLGVFFSLQR